VTALQWRISVVAEVWYSPFAWRRVCSRDTQEISSASIDTCMIDFDQWREQDKRRARAAIDDLMHRLREAGIPDHYIGQLMKQLAALTPDLHLPDDSVPDQ